MSEGDYLRHAARLWEGRTCQHGGRTLACGVGFYSAGRDDHGDRREDITFYRYDRRYGGSNRGQVMRSYRHFTGASARRVQRLIYDGEAKTFDNGWSQLYKRFREWPEAKES